MSDPDGFTARLIEALVSETLAPFRVLADLRVSCVPRSRNRVTISASAGQVNLIRRTMSAEGGPSATLQRLVDLDGERLVHLAGAGLEVLFEGGASVQVQSTFYSSALRNLGRSA